MIGGIAILLVLAAACLLYIAAPLFRSDSDTIEKASAHLSEAREWQSRHEMALASLKDLEDDRATEKIGEQDYVELKGRLSARAVETMKHLDQLEAQEKSRQAAGPRAVPVPDASPNGPA